MIYMCASVSGESLEDACRREVEEEVGVALRSVKYYVSQPWPMPSVLMLGFLAEADSDLLKVSYHNITAAC